MIDSRCFRYTLSFVAWGLVGAASLMLAGCRGQTSPVIETTSETQKSQTITADNANGTSQQIVLLLPAKIDVLPFTKVASFDDDPIPDGIEVVLRPLDAFGDQTKCVGVFRFEAYQHRKASADPRGQRFGMWEVDLSSRKAQQLHWDRITRTYRFRLKWADDRPKLTRLVLEATFISPWGQRIGTTSVLDVKMPRAELKEESEKKRNPFGLF